MKELFLAISQRLIHITSTVLLSLSYALGIGPTSVIGKLARKQFLDMFPKKTTWTIRPKDSAPKYMY